jgi:hypothetical protein
MRKYPRTRHLVFMNCPLCRRLEAEYHASQHLHVATARVLNERTETATTPEYSRLQVAKSDARIDAELARLQLDRHRLMHELTAHGSGGISKTRA